jgi:Protein of unknown function (DUF2934)
MHDLEKAIRERAYHLWLEGGCQHGHADAHWLTAQREILSASLSEIAITVSEQPLAKTSKSPRRIGAKKKHSAA